MKMYSDIVISVSLNCNFKSVLFLPRIIYKTNQSETDYQTKTCLGIRSKSDAYRRDKLIIETDTVFLEAGFSICSIRAGAFMTVMFKCNSVGPTIRSSENQIIMTRLADRLHIVFLADHSVQIESFELRVLE